MSRLESLAPLHFLGVNGSGMAPLAEFTSAFGVTISGSDLHQSSWLDPSRYFLQGSPDEAAVISNSKSVVFSSAIAESNSSLTLAKRLNMTILHRSDLLSEFSSQFKTISVAGTHGKTTTSALITHILSKLAKEPSWIIGATLSDGRPAHRLGKSDIFIIEADESDGSFVKYRSFVSLVNNIEPDHLDYYLNTQRLHTAFENFISHTDSNGALIFNADDPTASNLGLKTRLRHLSFGTSALANFQLLNSSSAGISTTGEFAYSGRHFTFTIPLAGQHNAMNALAAIAACSALSCEVKDCVEAVKSFPGVTRRLQKYESKSGVLIFDDYAHNPGKIKSCLVGLAAAFPRRRILIAFQPHRFTRLSTMYRNFIESFNLPNIHVIVLPVYSAGEPTLSGFSPELLAKDIAETAGVQTSSANSLKEAADLIESIVDPNRDVVVTIGAGDVWRVAEDVAGRPL